MVIAIEQAVASNLRHRNSPCPVDAGAETRKLARKMVQFLCIMGGLYVVARIVAAVK